MERVLRTDFENAASMLGITPCPKTVQIEELKKWLLQLSEKENEIFIITSVPDYNEAGKTYAVTYDKTLCAYWVISDEEEVINKVIENINNGLTLPESVEDK